MNLNLSQYWQLITQYTNPAEIIFSAIISSIIAAIGILLAMIFLRKYILIKRQYRVLKVMAIAYFIVLPLLAGFLGFKWGLVKGLKEDLKEHLTKNTHELDLLLKEKIVNDSVYIDLVGKTGLDSLDFSANDVTNILSAICHAHYIALLEETSASSN